MSRRTQTACGLLVAYAILLATVEAQTLEQIAKPFAQSLIDGERVVGVSLGVIANGKQATIHLGHTAMGKPVADDDTLYEIGSISKVFTSLMLADAVANGALTLDAPAGSLLPDGAKMPTWDEDHITLKHLATHRSGLPRLPSNLTEATSENPYDKYDSTRATEFLKGFQLTRAPGEKYEYSNFGASLLGYLLCQHADKTYDELLRTTITAPIQMNATTVTLNDAAKAKLATPHDGSLKPTNTWEFADMPGAGGIRSSIADMMKFATANLHPPAGSLGAAIKLAWKQQQKAGGPGEFAMGLGWHIAGDGSTRWHNGGTGGYRSMMFVSRDLGIAVVMLSNTSSDAIDPTAELLVQKLAGADVKPLTFDKEVDVPVAKMKRLEGRYQLAPTFVFDVKVDDGKLMVGITNQPTQQVYPKSEFEWFYKVVQAKLVFKVNDDGTAESLTLHQNGVQQVAPRVTN